MSDIVIFKGFGGILLEVMFALIPLIGFFLFFQVFLLKLNRKQFRRILIGIVFTYFGLAFFLQGVYIGFFPVGELMGETLAGLPYSWIIVPIGFLLGFVATIAEPAVRVLNHEVDKVSSGYIPQKVLLYTLCVGVGFSIAMSMLRILLGIPLYYLIVPGYLIALVMLYYSTPTFTAVAFDSGGVATGPMTVTFIMAMAIGVASMTEGRDPMIDGFGMIALVALAPILSVLTLGLLYSWLRKRKD